MNLKEIRKHCNLTQQQVADHLNCSAVAYSRYENGIREPSIDILIKLAALFDVSVDYLVGNQRTESSGLSKDEINILQAYKEADQRAREDALIILRQHKAK